MLERHLSSEMKNTTLSSSATEVSSEASSVLYSESTLRWVIVGLLSLAFLIAGSLDVHANPDRFITSGSSSSQSFQSQPCGECVRVVDVQPTASKPKASGIGAAVGGLIGGWLGREIGQQNNARGAMTVLGAIGGSMIGHQIEKRVLTSTSYDVTVENRQGSRLVIHQNTPVRIGQWVVIRDGVAQPVPETSERQSSAAPETDHI